MTNLQKLIKILDSDLVTSAIVKYWDDQDLNEFNIDDNNYILLDKSDVKALLLDQIENGDEIYDFINGSERINFRLANLIDAYDLAALYVERYFSAEELSIGDDEIEYEYIDESEGKFIYIKH